MKEDNTGVMFQLIVGKGGEDLAADLGLSAAAVSLLCAQTDQVASTEAMMVSMVFMSADLWLEVVEQAIEDLENQQTTANDYDIQVLKGMGGWTYDHELLEAMAREEWFTMFCNSFNQPNPTTSTQTMH